MGHKLEIQTWANMGCLILYLFGLYFKTHNTINNYLILFYYINLTYIYLIIINSLVFYLLPIPLINPDYYKVTNNKFNYFLGCYKVTVL
jgi:hypothetical protein